MSAGPGAPPWSRDAGAAGGRPGRTRLDGVRPVPGDWLNSLATVMKLSALEWRIAALVMARGPISVFALAKVLRLNYTLAKRGARSLGTWNIVSRTPDGLVFQPDPNGWDRGAQATPVTPRAGSRKPSRLPTAPATAPSPAEQEVELTMDPWDR